MPASTYNRYSLLRNNDGTTDTMPFVNLPINASDKYEYWNSDFSRLDKISLKYYGDPGWDFLILIANNQYVSEFDFPSDYLLRIPFPLMKAKADFEAAIIVNKNK